MERNIGQSNGSLPLLTLSPVTYSLTDGTSIPAPTEDQNRNLQAQNGDGSLSADLRGPLSSHPVTPIEEPIDQGEFPTYNWSRDTKSKPTNGTGSASAAYHAQAMASQGNLQATLPTNGTSRHAPHPSDDSNNFDPALPSHQPARDTSRRPSFVDRFLPRLRSSSSFLRSRSKSSLGQYGESSSNLSQMGMTTNETRGLKRPASPSSGRPDSRGGASTFPRMVRKKSMELLSSARRKSGMWTTNDREAAMSNATANHNANGYADRMVVSAMDEERERERLRELEERNREPPPQLPQLGRDNSSIAGAALDGEAMFGNIGR